MGKEVLILTGACGVGKTSTAKAWAKIKNGAIIECDYLTEWIYKDDFPHWTEEEEIFTSNLSAMMAREYLKNGMSVAIENVWSPLGIENIKNALLKLNDVKVTTVWLRCDLEENHKRDENRIPEDQMKTRVDIVNDELNSYKWPDYLRVIDSTSMTLEEVVSEIQISDQLK